MKGAALFMSVLIVAGLVLAGLDRIAAGSHWSVQQAMLAGYAVGVVTAVLAIVAIAFADDEGGE